jgi:threonyl-tRNA synthetase
MNRQDIVKNIQSKHLILLPDGEEHFVDLERPDDVKKILDVIGNQELKSYVLSEELKGEGRPEAPSIKMMQQHELVGYEPASDSGHFRLYPKGHLLFELLKDWADHIAVERLHAMQIDSPVIYDWADDEIREQASSFHERHYVVKQPDSDKEFILRFAGDFGLFKIMQQANFSHRMLPVRVYEFSKSFRYERSGELSGLKRLRAFHMPDIHCFCKDLAQGWDEYQHLYRHYADLADASGVSYAIGFRIVDSFYKEHKNRIVQLLQHSQRPAFIELLSDMKHYWAVKHEFQVIDSVGGNLQLSTVQLDVKDAAVYGIDYVDQDGIKRGCIICHSSIGSIERWMYAVLEEAHKRDRPMLPLWLAPAQVRVLPVSPDCFDACKNLVLDGVRWELDDSDDSLAKKIAKAGKDWVPYVVVVGPNELASGKLAVSRRIDGSKQQLSADELVREVRDRCAGMPYRPLPLPRLLSLRPKFHG